MGIQGRVNGDVVAAGGTVTIHGTVTGDLLAAGGTTTVAGTVGGTVRVVRVPIPMASAEDG